MPVGDVGGNRQDAIVTVSGLFQPVRVHVESGDELSLGSEIARRESAHPATATGNPDTFAVVAWFHFFAHLG